MPCGLRVRWQTLTLIVAGGLVFAAVCALAQIKVEISSAELKQAQEMLSQAHQQLKQNYYDPSLHGVDVDKRYATYRDELTHAPSVAAAYRMIAAYLAGLNDSHTIFIPPPNTKRVRYAFRLQMIGDKCFVTDVRPGSNTARELHPGDRVESIDGYVPKRMDFWQLGYYLYRLPVRSSNEFILRDASGNERVEKVTLEFQEDNLAESQILHRRLESEKQEHIVKPRLSEESDVMFLKLSSFFAREVDIDHMFALTRKHRALVLDLRGNGGGVLEGNLLLTLGNLFDHDVTVARKVMRAGEKSVVAKSRGHNAFRGQLVVLIDSLSSAGAELLARVVQIEHRGSVVGDQSAGSVMSTKFYPFRMGADVVAYFGVEITEADVIMTDGESLEKIGVAPDEMILPTAADLAEGRDPVLARAAELAGAQLDAASAGKMFLFDWAVY
jgi:C-terminal processing protease CtpA/Prc